MKLKITYFSYDGILEPLGNSQVLSYLLHLSKDFDIVLFSFEKEVDLKDIQRLEYFENLCLNNNIIWNKSSFVSSGVLKYFNPLKYFLFLLRNLFVISDTIHARSFIPAFVAYLISFIKSNCRYIYDMRGYWIEEKIDTNILKRNSILCNVLILIDKRIIIRASHIVTLSNISTSYLRNKFAINSSKISTIYTCTDTNKFRILEKNVDRICFGYVGTTVGWYLFDKTLDFISIAFRVIPYSTFKIVTRDNKEFIIRQLVNKNIDISRVTIKSADFESIQNEFAEINVAVFFIKESFSKTASMPTKFGEFLAAGIPCVVNGQIGDMASIIKEHPQCGYIVDQFSSDSYNIILRSILSTIIDSDVCRNVAISKFGLDLGVSYYRNVYNHVSNE